MAKNKTTNESLTATYEDVMPAETIDVFGTDAERTYGDSIPQTKTAYILYANGKDYDVAKDYAKQYFTNRGLSTQYKKLSDLTNDDWTNILTNVNDKYESITLCGIGKLNLNDIKNIYNAYGDKFYVFESDAAKISKLNYLSQIKGLRLTSRSTAGCVYCYLYDPTDSSYDDDNNGTPSTSYPSDISALNKYVSCNYSTTTEYSNIMNTLGISTLSTDDLKELINGSSITCNVCLNNTYIGSVPAVAVFTHSKINPSTVSSAIDTTKYYAVVSLYKPADTDWQIDITKASNLSFERTSSGSTETTNTLYYTYNGKLKLCERYLPYQIISNNSDWVTLSLNYANAQSAYDNMPSTASNSAKAIANEKATSAKTALENYENNFIDELNKFSLSICMSKYKGKGSNVSGYGTLSLTQFYNILKTRNI